VSAQGAKVIAPLADVTGISDDGNTVNQASGNEALASTLSKAKKQKNIFSRNGSTAFKNKLQ
jgi:hypothetical protein